jgi:hypothetical protein
MTHILILLLEACGAIVVAGLAVCVVVGVLRGVADVWRMP